METTKSDRLSVLLTNEGADSVRSQLRRHEPPIDDVNKLIRSRLMPDPQRPNDHWTLDWEGGELAEVNGFTQLSRGKIRLVLSSEQVVRKSGLTT